MTVRKAQENTLLKGENAGNQNFVLFPQCFPLLSKREFTILATCNSSSASAFNLATSKVLSFGKELTHSHTITPFDAPGKQDF